VLARRRNFYAVFERWELGIQGPGRRRGGGKDEYSGCGVDLGPTKERRVDSKAHVSSDGRRDRTLCFVEDGGDRAVVDVD